MLTSSGNLDALITQREKLIKIGVKVVRTARYEVFQMAEVAVPGICSGPYWIESTH